SKNAAVDQHVWTVDSSPLDFRFLLGKEDAIFCPVPETTHMHILPVQEEGIQRGNLFHRNSRVPARPDSLESLRSGR
uniref:Uncharacterized protein n=1 Tax=Aegilops tauschii subsp. strangulata TaxID=200361 RepID=A0A453DZW0_AEGTS